MMFKASGSGAVQENRIHVPVLRDADFSALNVGYVVGDNFTVRRTNNSGISWQTVTPSTLSSVATDFDLHLVQTVNYNDAYMLGTAGAARANPQGVATKIPGFPTDIIASDNNAAQLVALKNNNTIYRYTIGTGGLTAAGTMTSGSNLSCVALQGPNHVMAGGNNIFKYFDNTNTEVTYSGAAITGNILAIDVKNANAVMVGEQGLYYRMKSTGADANGVLEGVNWTQVQGLYNEDLIINANTHADVYTVAIGSATQIVYGGHYESTFLGTLNPVTVPFVRSAFDPGERYSSRFYYDKLGRLVVSENARQYNGNDRKFSYTVYDNLGRVIEVGEKTENEEFFFRDIFGSMVSGHYNPKVIDDAKLLAWIGGDGERNEVTRSYYDVFRDDFYTPPFAVNQDNQRKRIAHVAYYNTWDDENLIAVEEYDHATHFVYDIHGNVTKLMQDNRKMTINPDGSNNSLVDHRVKTMEYSYDLVSGNVHRMSVQTASADQWHHAYTYDADNRITEVYTSTQTPLLDISYPSQSLTNELAGNSDWTLEANYFYYAHGPLARTELGNELQGLDYIYNLQGWLKGVNATSLDNALDPGGDGVGLFSKDVMAFSLHYYNGDYTPIGGVALHPACSINYANTTLNTGVGNELNLYNGNIRFMQTTLTDIPTGDALPMLNAYKYDQLNRLLESRSYTDGLSSNIWTPTTYDDKYFNAFTYDANGNILTQKRHNAAGNIWEDLTYHYLVDGSGNLVRNRLYHVRDYAGVTSPTYNNPSGTMSSQMDANNSDLDDQGQFIDASIFEVENDNNYKYDEEGRLIQDLAEGIENIVWRVDGKVKKVIFTSVSGKNNLEFDYDAFGRRIAKHVWTQGNVLVKSTYYLLDVSGNLLSVMEHTVTDENSEFTLKERNIYGSSALGLNKHEVDLLSTTSSTFVDVVLGEKFFNLSNHLGNVLTTISDIKVPESLDNISVTSYRATIVNTYDYSPYGVMLDGRTQENEFIRSGFNGMERDDELKGMGNSYDFGARLYDSRLGRWLTIDKRSGHQPSESSYKAFHNSPLIYTDPDGNYEFLTIVVIDQRTGTKLVYEVSQVVSERIMAHGTECHGFQPFENGGAVTTHCYDTYYDFEKIITVTIDESSKISIDVAYEIIEENGIRDRDLRFGPVSAAPNEIKDKPDGTSAKNEFEKVSRMGGLTFYSKDGQGFGRKGKSWGSANIDDLLAAAKLCEQAGVVFDIVSKTSSIRAEFFSEIQGQIVERGFKKFGSDINDRIIELQQAEKQAARTAEHRGSICVTTKKGDYLYNPNENQWFVLKNPGDNAYSPIDKKDVDPQAVKIVEKALSKAKN